MAFLIDGVDVGAGIAAGNTALNLAQSAYARANTVSGLNNIALNASNGLSVNNGSYLTFASNTAFSIAANSASVNAPGVVQLNDTLISNSISMAATSNSVNTVWITAISAFLNANNALARTGGTITGNLSLSGVGITLNVSNNAIIGSNLTVSGTDIGVSIQSLTKPIILIANGTTQNTATSTTFGFLNIVVTANVNTGIILKSSDTYKKIVNKTANGVYVYPFIGAQIDSYGANQPVLLPNTNGVELAITSPTQIYIV